MKPHAFQYERKSHCGFILTAFFLSRALLGKKKNLSNKLHFCSFLMTASEKFLDFASLRDSFLGVWKNILYSKTFYHTASQNVWTVSKKTLPPLDVEFSAGMSKLRSTFPEKPFMGIFLMKTIHIYNILGLGAKTFRTLIEIVSSGL